MSRGPGWRELRYFAACALFAAIFAASNALVTLQVSAATLVLTSHFTLAAAGLHGAAWFAYAAAQDARPMRRFERVMFRLGIGMAGLSLVPHLFVSEFVEARTISWMHTTYRDALPTAAGTACYAFYCFALVALDARYFLRWRKGKPESLPHFIGIAALLVTAINDSLTAARVYDAPYLLDFGFLAVVGCVGSAVTARFVATARSLEDHTRQLTFTQAELVKRERLAALGELSAVVAHEVRNPVSIMFNAFSVLKREGRSERETETLLGIVEEEAERLKRLVDDLLAFAHPHDLRLSRTSIGPLIASAAEAARSAAKEPGLDIVLHVPTELPPITCDEQLVRAALINLITNAMQASRRVEPVNVRVALEPGEPGVFLITVSDDGAGVPPALAPRLFTPFFTTRPTGTGLGLAVVRRVAEAHGGEAKLGPSSERGATFWLRLPAEIDPALEPAS